MMNKTDIFRSILFSALVCLLLWDGLIWFISPDHQLPEYHRMILLTGFLVWFVSIPLNRDSDDDWAGQF